MIANTYFQQHQYFLAEIIIEIGVLRVRHVVNEYEAGFLSFYTLQSHIKLIDNSLEFQEKHSMSE